MQTSSFILIAGLCAAGCAATNPDVEIDRELARLAEAHAGSWRVGEPIYAVDDPAGTRIVTLDRDMIATKLAFDAAYRERVRAEDSRFRPFSVIGNDSRTIVSTPRSYPYSKHVFIVVQRPNADLTDRRSKSFFCSGTFLDEDFVLTAGHCVYNWDEDHWAYANVDRSVRPNPLDTQWGTDYGRGYACLGDDIDSITEFASNCEFVEARWAPPNYVTQTGDKLDTDYAVIKLERANHPSGMGAGRWMAMSPLDSGGDYQSKTAVMNGFPAVGPSSSIGLTSFSVTDSTISDPALRTAPWEFQTNVNLYHRSGAVDNRTNNTHLVYTADSSDGDSGSAVFYYSDGATSYNGQSHYIMGVHHGEYDTGVNGGAAVHEFRDWVTTTMSSN